MRLIRSRGELHDFWLVSNVSLVAMMFRSAKSCIVLADFFLHFLLDHIQLAAFVRFKLRIHLVWLGLSTGARRRSLVRIWGKFSYIWLLCAVLGLVIRRDAPMHL